MTSRGKQWKCNMLWGKQLRLEQETTSPSGGAAICNRSVNTRNTIMYTLELSNNFRKARDNLLCTPFPTPDRTLHIAFPFFRCLRAGKV